MVSQAMVPILLSRSESKVVANGLAVAIGVVFLSLLAQVAIPLPWTPVPITGQTLGVSLVGLAWGWKRGFSVVGIYLILGSLGLPVFAQAGLATSGYLAGMLVAATVEGYASDRGWTKTFGSALLTAYVGSFFVFGFGLLILSQYVDRSHLLMAGLYPFLIGDSVKNMIAAGLRVSAQRLT